MRFLLIEDDVALQDIITKKLQTEGYSVDTCGDGVSGYDYASSVEYDCIILDIMLPGRNGIDVLRQLRGEGNASYILLLTARDGIEERVAGLDAGADDYLIKPFAFEELLARVRTLMRRQSVIRDSLLSLGDLTMNVSEHTVVRGDKKIDLTAREYALLEYLLRNQGKALTRTQISDHVWNNEFEYDSNIVDVYVRYLRGKIDKPFERKLIQTVRGVGYTIKCDQD